jgi:cation diffusion facilitator family transporter
MSYKKARKILILILFLNLLVAVAKAIFGILSGSLSMISDAFHSSFDSLSNIIGIIATTIAMREADYNHPYGHGKFESLGTLFIGSLLLITSFWIVKEAYIRLKTNFSPEISTITVSVMILTIIVNIFVYSYERKKGEELGSHILIADSSHTKSDIYVSLSVLGSFLLIKLGLNLVDPLLALAIAILIAKMGVGIAKESAMVLTDAKLIECEEEIKRAILEVEGVEGYHKFRCRGKPGEMYADVHITVHPSLTVEEAHEIAERVEKKITKEFDFIKEITIHLEPENKIKR